MPNLTLDLQFKYRWRTYQETFLKSLEKHRTDHHLHLIAPPGSGKTILGIEIVRQINKKTLVLAPTLTIRNQWKDKLLTFFTEKNSFQSFSFELKTPATITFSTYQSLHAFYKSFEIKKDFFAFFHDHGIECIVLDEAHHLKNEWWKCLISLKEDKHFTIVALTATPPYDSEQLEISRYFSLCGPVDEEISVPDLVKEGDLCPHQDFVYFSKPKQVTINAIVSFRKKVADFITHLKTDKAFLSLITTHRFYAHTNQFLTEIYDEPEYFSSLLIFLHASGHKIPQKKLQVLGFGNEKIVFPELDFNWITVLLHHLIRKDRDNLQASEMYLLQLETQLRNSGMLEKGKISVTGKKQLFRALANSPAKLDSIVEICNFEYRHLKNDLRCVILTDYIRKEFLQLPDASLEEINRMGVVPVFRYLRKKFDDKSHIGILSGSLVLVHKKVLTSLKYTSIIKDDVKLTELKIDPDFLLLTTKSSSRHKLTALVTLLFEKGIIKILVGTKSLLGEGWDAPSINSLILASTVGSFVTSNQMRGRAIRSQKGNTNKTGIIWHLASIDPTVQDGGFDIEKLKRRFEAFVGISETAPTYIENGFERLVFPENFNENTIEDVNATTFSRAGNRHLIVDKWKKAIDKGSQMARELKLVPYDEIPYQKQKKVYYRDAVMYMIAEVLIGISFFLPEFLLKNLKILVEKGVINFMYILLIALALGFGKKLMQALMAFIKFGTRHKKVDGICKAVIATFVKTGHITTSLDLIQVHTEIRDNGEVVCIVKGCSNLEGNLIINALNEVLGEINNPRYLLVSKSWWRKLLKLEQVFPVPDMFGGKKEDAQLYLQYWKQRFGGARVIFTRNLQGRKVLLKARIVQMSTLHKNKNRKAVIWR